MASLEAARPRLEAAAVLLLFRLSLSTERTTELHVGATARVEAVAQHSKCALSN